MGNIALAKRTDIMDDAHCRLTPVHLHECPQCHSQLGTTRSLWAHKTKPRQCLVGGFCKQDHSHSFVVKKYSSRDADD